MPDDLTPLPPAAVPSPRPGLRRRLYIARVRVRNRVIRGLLHLLRWLATENTGKPFREAVTDYGRCVDLNAKYILDLLDRCDELGKMDRDRV